ncbi:hypothetical protein ACN9J5_10590 [Aliarcobacter butzleri]|uniref:hypothetical protein n=1 Tax=Aliarcobacter butzleri TaxID=28197 RepID=UPI003B2170E6
MIEIKPNSTYQKEFCKNLETCLYKQLKKSIENKKVLSPQNKEIIDDLSDDDIECLKYLKINIKRIVGGDLETLQKIINEVTNEITNKYKKNDEKPKIYQAVKYIFVDRGYEAKISTTSDTSIAYKLVENLRIKTCPYCNRSYISFVKIKKKKTRPQLDHFYPKAIYPFLACSFYNLIPSCSACNHMKSDDDSYKDEKDGKLVHPYNVKDSDFTFSYTFNNLDILKSIDEKNIKFEDEEKIKITLDKKYEKNNEYFQLETIYQNHKDIVIELILKEINYPRSYINELIKNGFGTEEEIYRFIFSNYLKIDDLHKRPLSKLTRDIVEELGILYKIELATKEEHSTKEQEN